MDLTNFDQRPPPPKPEKKEKPTYTANDAIEDARENFRVSAEANKRITPQEVAQRDLAFMNAWLKMPAVDEWATRIALTDGIMTQYITKDQPMVEPIGESSILVRSDSFQIILALDRISMLSIEQGREEE